MKRFFICVLFIIMIFSNSGCGSEAVTAHKAQASQYNISSAEISTSIKTINIKIDSANLQIFCWDKQEIKIEAKHTVRDSKTADELENLLKRYSIETKAKDNTFFFSVAYNGKIKNSKDYFSDIKLTIPKRIKDLILTQENGSFAVEDKYEGNISGKLDSVNTEINDMEGKLALTCHEGNLRVKSGKLLNGSDVVMNYGNIYIKAECENMSKYTFQTETGNVELNFPVNSNIILDTFGMIQNNQFTGLDGDIEVKVQTKIGKISVNGY